MATTPLTINLDADKVTAEVRAYIDSKLAALLDGAEVREEWGCRLTWDDGHHEDTWLGERKYAHLRYDLHQRRRADNPGWRVTPTLIRRLHLTLPAETVEE